MHELSLAESLVQLIEQAAAGQGFTRVRKAWLEIGALAGVEPEALRFGFEVAARASCAEGAALEILSVPGVAWCYACCRSVTIAAYQDGCPECGGLRLRVTGGDRLRLKELEVE